MQKTFNRGYTNYFANGRRPDIASFDTPKAIGEFVGTVKEIRRDSFTVAGTARFANGDGLCFFASPSALQGFRVNRVEGNRLFPQHMPEKLRPGLRLYRNSDQEFDRLLSRPSAERKIPVTLSLRPTPDGFALSSGDVTVSIQSEHQTAEKPQRENIVRQLTKLGNTPYECHDVNIPADFNYFIPSSQLAELRRELVGRMGTMGRVGEMGNMGVQGDVHSAHIAHIAHIAHSAHIAHPTYPIHTAKPPLSTASVPLPPMSCTPRPRPCSCSAGTVSAMRWASVSATVGGVPIGTNRSRCAWAMGECSVLSLIVVTVK